MRNAKEDAMVSELQSFLSQGFCDGCSDLLLTRLRSLSASSASGTFDGIRIPSRETMSPSSTITRSCVHASPPTDGGSSTRPLSSRSSASSYLSKALSASTPYSGASSDGRRRSHGEGEVTSVAWDEGRQNGGGVHHSSSEEREWLKFSNVKSKKDYVLMENVKGRKVNVLKGLELHSRVFDAKEQEDIVNCVYEFQKLGRAGRLRERTYSEPRKWMRGKGRVTIQFGCCYNYATDKYGNSPGIIRDEEVDPLPPLFKAMIKRMVRWHVLPPSCVPNSCIVNIYDEGDCIPPHIDHHDFVRPFCTASFLSECNILFGHNIEVAGPGEFFAPTPIPLPTGSVFILNGNGADVAKHCVPACPAKRISITFRRMDDAKTPVGFKPDPELQGIRPLQRPDRPRQPQVQATSKSLGLPHISQAVAVGSGERVLPGNDDFPPLTRPDSTKKRNLSKHSIRQ